MKIRISDLWRWDVPLNRARYLLWGSILFAIKFNMDRFVSWWWFGKPWSIFQYENINLGKTISSDDSGFQLGTLFLLSLPFLWLGAVLTIRRLHSAKLPLWLVVLFVVPVVKVILFAILCVFPERNKGSARQHKPSEKERHRLDQIMPQNPLGSAALAVFITVSLTLGLIWLSTDVWLNYGWALFLGMPFCMGFLSVLIFGYHQPRTPGACLGVVSLTVVLAGIGLVMFAFEGLLCLIMAAPLAFGMALVGGAIAYAIQSTRLSREEPPKLFCCMLLVMPLCMGWEHFDKQAPPLLKVTTAVEINATPETVWKNVVTFSELPPPHELIFHAGIAYPIRAEIKGTGVGAVRYCGFSTGPFVEPIEVWDEPNLLKFGVTSNPSPMQELSPYRNLHPPHLDGFLVSKVGQFHLVHLSNGYTLLEGTTWYRHGLWPARYWQLWSDYIIHKIHLRVLNHVKNLSEMSLAQGK